MPQSRPQPAAPPLRHFAGEADIPGMWQVHEESREHDRVDDRSAREGTPSLGEMRALFDGVAPDSPDVVVAEVGGVVAGYCHTRWRWTEEDGTWVAGFVEDNFRHSRHNPALWHLAWTGDEVAGFVYGVLRDQTGIVPEVAVRKARQRRGIGRALLTLTLLALREQGAEEVRIVTNADNPLGARSLYESLGFRPLKTVGLYRKRMEEVGAE